MVFHRWLSDRITVVRISGLPFGIKSVADALFDAPGEQDLADRSEGATGFLFSLLNSFVDLLNMKANRQEAGDAADEEGAAG
ncbi:MAG: hypothetical protein JXD19_08200 [Deltaproteobacteria bacterium]|nr:hypothetical protein [Deltaproteobacteria bacterium]